MSGKQKSLHPASQSVVIVLGIVIAALTTIFVSYFKQWWDATFPNFSFLGLNSVEWIMIIVVMVIVLLSLIIVFIEEKGRKGRR